MRTVLALINLLWLFALAPPAGAAEGAPALLTLREQTIPRSGGRSFASFEAFQAREIFVIVDPNYWEFVVGANPDYPHPEALIRLRVPFDQLEEAEQLRLRRHVPLEQLRQLSFFVYDPESPRQRGIVTPDLRTALYRAVAFAHDKFNVYPPPFIFDSQEDLEAKLTRAGVTSAVRQQIQAQAVEFDGRVSLPLNREIGKLLPAAMRAEITRSELWDPVSQRFSYQATLRVDPTTIPEIVRIYGGAHPQALEQKLRDHLRASATSSTRLPLTDVLTPFIRDQLGRFGTLAESNCLGVSLCRSDFVSAESFVAEVGRRFDAVAPGEALRPEDLVVYWRRERNGNLHLYHAALYVGDGLDEQGVPRSLLFTKNGVSADQPALITDRARVEAIYREHALKSHGSYPGLAMSVHRRRPEGAPARPGPQMRIYEDTTRPASPCVQAYAIIDVGLRGR